MNTLKKANAKNQLSPEHIDKIVNTYKYRSEEDQRYSRRVAMSEIEENGYNLNISRYVSTSKTQETIDLEATNLTLVEIEKKVKEATDLHNAFLEELGLPLLPR